MPKKPRSFSIDEDINEILSSREDLNASAAVNTFLREYVSSGRGEEAALEIRLNQLDEEIGELKQSLQQKERERDRIEAQLESRRSNLVDVLDRVEEKIKTDQFPRENVHADNLAIQKWAGEAGLPVDEFVSKLESRL